MSRYAKRIAAPPAKAGPARQQPRPAPLLRPSLSHVLQLRAAQSARAATASATPSQGGLPAGLKAGVEQLSGIAMDDVRVHRNSSAPAKLGALAYAQGSDIHLGPGQERHLPHEAWHIVQQKQGRVKATLQAKGIAINEDGTLEREADLFGEKALGMDAAIEDPKRRPPIEGAPAGGATQLKKLTAPSGVSVEPTANIVYFTGGAKSVSSYWQSPPIKIAQRTDLLRTISAKAAEVGTAVDKQANDNWNFNPNQADNEDVNFFDPVRVRFNGRYKDNANRNLTLDYHFGNRWSGYVIHVTDTGRNIDREMHDPDSVLNMGNTEYSNAHDFDANSQATLDATAGADAVTKIAGEGARWQAVADNADTIKDRSRIFTNETADGSLTTQVRHISFRTLWLSWAATFNKAYGIPDQVVAGKLMAANVQTGTGENIQNVGVGTGPSSGMVHGTDISVDSIKPASANDLAATTVAILRYKKNTSVVTSRRSFTEEMSDAWGAVAAAAGQGAVKQAGSYVSDDKFAFICSWPGNGNPAAAGYTYQQGEGVSYEVPAYRVPVGVAKAKGHKDAPASGGNEKFESDRKTIHDAKTRALNPKLAAQVRKEKQADAKTYGDVDAAIVISKKFPWVSGQAIDVALLRETDWTELDLKTLITDHVAARAILRTAEVTKRMGTKKYPTKYAKDQAKSKIKTEVADAIK
jgi:hypothetical protein